jgi:hypothetical protein
MEALVEKLLSRRSRIRELIEAFASSDRKPFPKWGLATNQNPGDIWNPERWGSTIVGRIM